MWLPAPSWLLLLPTPAVWVSLAVSGKGSRPRSLLITTADSLPSYTPDMLREQIAELKGYLNDKNAPFGVDLLLPQVGGSARKTK